MEVYFAKIDLNRLESWSSDSYCLSSQHTFDANGGPPCRLDDGFDIAYCVQHVGGSITRLRDLSRANSWYFFDTVRLENCQCLLFPTTFKRYILFSYLKNNSNFVEWRLHNFAVWLWHSFENIMPFDLSFK